MPAIVIIGGQWGDEGKGKLIDALSPQFDFVVRYQGGANAGHTLQAGQNKLVVHLIPSAVLHPHVRCVISAGVALDIFFLCEEIQHLKRAGHLLNNRQLLISEAATVLLPVHRQLDQAREERAGRLKIGTTGKGIGPAYESRVSRKALVFGDLFEDDSILLEKLKIQLEELNFLLSRFYGKEPVSAQQILGQIKNCRDVLEPYRCRDSSLLLSQALEKGRKVLFEGAQGSLLDWLYGSYPYVTSSSTLAGGALPCSGLGFHHFKKTIAVVKAYTTRVGEGPFPTECLKDPAGSYLQEKGGEFGATTGRKRRCGWLDIPALKYSLRLNGAKSIALTKLDVLSGLERIKACVAYQTEGEKEADFLQALRNGGKIKPLYKVFKGWSEDLSRIQSLKQLPAEAKEYIDFISSELNTPIDVISLGPSREQILGIENLAL